MIKSKNIVALIKRLTSVAFIIVVISACNISTLNRNIKYFKFDEDFIDSAQVFSF